MADCLHSPSAPHTSPYVTRAHARNSHTKSRARPRENARVNSQTRTHKNPPHNTLSSARKLAARERVRLLCMRNSLPPTPVDFRLLLRATSHTSTHTRNAHDREKHFRVRTRCALRAMLKRTRSLCSALLLVFVFGLAPHSAKKTKTTTRRDGAREHGAC